LAVAYTAAQQSSQAIATAQKALEIARAKGQAELARQIEIWLNSYLSGLQIPKTPSNSKFLPPEN
jgi:hypothetical protein